MIYLSLDLRNTSTAVQNL